MIPAASSATPLLLLACLNVPLKPYGPVSVPSWTYCHLVVTPDERHALWVGVCSLGGNPGCHEPPGLSLRHAGGHWPPLDDPGLSTPLLLFLGLPQPPPETLGACLCFPGNFSPSWGSLLMRETLPWSEPRTPRPHWVGPSVCGEGTGLCWITPAASSA